MKTLSSLLALVLASALPLSAKDACCSAAKAPTTATDPAAALPGDSLYQLTAVWRDQNGRDITLADFAGQPVIITMIFTHCAYACPRIVADLKNIRDALPAAERERVRFVLASFDTARDTPDRLRAWAAEQNLDSNWTLLHGDAPSVRELSVALELPFMSQVDGGFAHGNRIVLLDASGVAVEAVEGLGAQPAPIASAVARLASRG